MFCSDAPSAPSALDDIDIDRPNKHQQNRSAKLQRGAICHGDVRPLAFTRNHPGHSQFHSQFLPQLQNESSLITIGRGPGTRSHSHPQIECFQPGGRNLGISFPSVAKPKPLLVPTCLGMGEGPQPGKHWILKQKLKHTNADSDKQMFAFCVSGCLWHADFKARKQLKPPCQVTQQPVAHFQL